jgi:Spy/CpxP family protein refolding chaperone
MALTKTIVVSGFATAFAAGLLFGIALHRAPPAATTQPTHTDRGSWWAEKLNLTTDQQQQMKQIWSEVGRRGGNPGGSSRGQSRKERDEAIEKLIRPEDRATYDSIIATYNARNEAAEAEMRASFDRAVQRTREILTPEQRKKYDELMPKPGQGNGSNPGSGGPGWDRDRGPSTRPTKQG